MNFDGD